MIEGHGDDLFRFNEKIRINFSLVDDKNEFCQLYC